MMRIFLSAIVIFILGKCFSQDSIQTFNIEEVIINDNRLSLSPTELSNTINVITQPVIKSMPVQSLNQLLQLLGGLDVRQRGPFDIQADLSIRGGTFDQTLVLINGVKMIDPQTGHHLLNLPINLQDVERIEIIKGPAARKYGQNAFAGAINIVTKKINSKNGYAKITAGQHGLGQLALGIQLPMNNIDQQISVSKGFSKGYRHNTDFDINQCFYQGNIGDVNNQFSLTGGYIEKKFGANGFYASPDFTEQYEETQTSFLNLEMKKVTKQWVITPRLYWRRNQDTYIFVRDNPSIYRNLHLSNNVAFELNTGYQSKLGSTGIGAEIRREFLVSNNLGAHERTVLSLYTEHRFVIMSKLDIHPGISFNHYSDFGTRIFPGIDIGFMLFPGTKLYGNLGSTYRIPTFTDLYYQDRVNEGNTKLEPESALTYEVGIKVNKQKLHSSISGFRRNANNLIDWGRHMEDEKWKPDNVGNLTISGLELDLQWLHPITALELLKFSYTFLHGSLSESSAPYSRYALENLKHQLIAAIDLKPIDLLTIMISYRYLDRVNLENYHLVNLQLTGPDKAFKPFITIDNLFNTKYKETNLVEMPGRWVRVGISTNFKY